MAKAKHCSALFNFIRLFRAAAFFSLLLLGPVMAWGQEQDQAAASAPARSVSRVAKVEFRGFDNLSPRTAQNVMESKVPAFFSFDQPQEFSNSRLERDRRQLETLYKEHGFFQARVTYEVAYNQDKSEAYVTFVSHELDPTLIESIELTYVNQADRQIWDEELNSIITLQPGQVFTSRAYEDLKDELGDYLADHGHPMYQIAGQVQVYTDTLKARIIFLLAPGPAYAFGPTRISGRQLLEEEYIIDQLHYLKGQAFAQNLVDASQNAIQSTGFFNSVVMEPRFDEAQNNVVPIDIHVREAKMHSLRLGLGWGTEDKFRVRLLQVNRNLLRLHETLIFEGKWSDIYQGIVGRLNIPTVFNRRSSFLLSGGLEQLEREAYDSNRLFIAPRFSYRWADRILTSLSWNAENDKLTDVKTSVKDKAFEEQNWFINSFIVGLNYDSRDSILDPKKGTYAGVDVELSFDALGSDISFVRPVAQASHVQPFIFVDDWFLAVRVKYGMVKLLDDMPRVPMVRRFFPGGANSVRGYALEKLGELDSGGRPYGGDYMIEGNVELRFPIWQELGGVMFCDFGNAQDSMRDLFEPLRFTAGAGLRYNTPIGPFRLDFGYKLNAPDNTDSNDMWAVYLSLGQAF